ncbi:MAG: hypothetical protein IT442_16705 [Phycisphaeraceae bacterium]|nr:hypothetical protein [Phycisphaeraceae bacterium]
MSYVQDMRRMHGWKRRPSPDLDRYMAWRRVLAEFPGGLMSRSEAARLLGVDPQTVSNWIQRSSPSLLDAITLPGDPPRMRLVSTAAVLDLVEKSKAPELWKVNSLDISL